MLFLLEKSALPNMCGMDSIKRIMTRHKADVMHSFMMVDRILSIITLLFCAFLIFNSPQWIIKGLSMVSGIISLGIYFFFRKSSFLAGILKNIRARSICIVILCITCIISLLPLSITMVTYGNPELLDGCTVMQLKSLASLENLVIPLSVVVLALIWYLYELNTYRKL